MPYTPLSSTNHANLRLTRGTFFHLQDKPCVPISVLEAGIAALDLPLAFISTQNGLSLMAVLSLQNDDNVHIGPKGLWMGGYIPAIVRAHPFSMRMQGDQGTVVVDTESDWLSTGEGQPLFDSEGNPTQILNNKIELVKKHTPNPNRDKPILESIEKSGVLSPFAEGQCDLKKIDPQKLAELDDQTFLNLRQNNALFVVYAQIMSMPRVTRLKNLAERKQKMQPQEVDVQNIFGEDDLIRFD